MPEVIILENRPIFFLEYKIEPFREEYIPGSRVLCIEKNNEEKVFFQITTPIAQNMSKVELEKLEALVHRWWLGKADTV